MYVHVHIMFFSYLHYLSEINRYLVVTSEAKKGYHDILVSCIFNLSYMNFRTHLGFEFSFVSESQAILISAGLMAGGWWPRMSPGVLEAMASLTSSSMSRMGMSGWWNTSPVFWRTGRDFRGLGEGGYLKAFFYFVFVLTNYTWSCLAASCDQNHLPSKSSR